MPMLGFVMGHSAASRLSLRQSSIESMHAVQGYKLPMPRGMTAMARKVQQKYCVATSQQYHWKGTQQNGSPGTQARTGKMAKGKSE
eukprot:5787920-Amphidinium_carterae.1